jgi:hypothetical protein
MANMKTTIYLDDDLFRELKAAAHREGCTLRETLNRALRGGLRPAAALRRKARAYACPSFAMGSPAAGVNLDKALNLAARLEDEEIVRELDLRK